MLNNISQLHSLGCNKDIDALEAKVQTVEAIYRKMVMVLPSSCPIMPGYKLRKHTRSVSWLVQEVINIEMARQQTDLGLRAFAYEQLADTSLHDCIVDDVHPVNIKVHNMEKKHTKNDLSSGLKLRKQYSDNPDYDLIYVCCGFYFDGSAIRFDPSYLRVFAAQFTPVYVNPRNHKLQAYYEHQPEYRTRDEFISLLPRST